MQHSKYSEAQERMAAPIQTALPLAKSWYTIPAAKLELVVRPLAYSLRVSTAKYPCLDTQSNNLEHATNIYTFEDQAF